MSDTTLIRVTTQDRMRINDRTIEYTQSRGKSLKPGDVTTPNIITYLLDKLERLEKEKV
jgi:pSer/pThr/pTyr-binding forkhead associated (FHA) protein